MAGPIVVLNTREQRRREGIAQGLAISQSLQQVSQSLLGIAAYKERQKDQELNTLLRAVDLFGGDPNTAPPAMRNRLGELLGIKGLPISNDGGVKFPVSEKIQVERYKNARLMDVYRRASEGDPQAIQERGIMEGTISPDMSESEKQFRREMSDATTNRLYIQSSIHRSNAIFDNILDIEKEMRVAGMKPTNQPSGYTLIKDRMGVPHPVPLDVAAKLRPDMKHKELTYGQAKIAQDLLNSKGSEKLRDLNIAAAKADLLNQLQAPDAMKTLQQLVKLSESGYANISDEVIKKTMDGVVGEMLANQHDPSLIDNLADILGESPGFFSIEGYTQAGQMKAKQRAIKRVNKSWEDALRRNEARIAIVKAALDDPIFADPEVEDTVNDRAPEGPTPNISFESTATPESAFSGAKEGIVTPDQIKQIDQMITAGASQGFSTGSIIAQVARSVGSRNPGVLNLIRSRVERLMRDQLTLNPPKPE